MCLTEPHCGTDLGILKTKAEPRGDGTYAVSGTKIFISAGEHDLTENIVHIVLARLPDAPSGTRGISLFIVPKFLPNADGSIGMRNPVNCASIEHKMGIHGNATCVLNFDDVVIPKSNLLGEEGQGYKYAISVLNEGRIGIAAQMTGLALGAWENAAR